MHPVPVAHEGTRVHAAAIAPDEELTQLAAVFDGRDGPEPEQQSASADGMAKRNKSSSCIRSCVKKFYTIL